MKKWLEWKFRGRWFSECLFVTVAIENATVMSILNLLNLFLNAYTHAHTKTDEKAWNFHKWQVWFGTVQSIASPRSVCTPWRGYVQSQSQTRKDLIIIQTTDARHRIPNSERWYVRQLSKLAPNYDDNRSRNHSFKVILQQRSQKICSKVSKVYL